MCQEAAAKARRTQNRGINREAARQQSRHGITGSSTGTVKARKGLVLYIMHKKIGTKAADRKPGRRENCACFTKL